MFRITSVNVRGLGSSRKLNQIIHELNVLKCDAFFLQETHVSCRKQAESFEKLWRGKCFWSFGTGKSAGVAVIFPPNFSGKIIRFLTDSDGRILSLLVDFHASVLNLVNIYAPNVLSDRNSFFSSLHNFFFSQGLLLLGGDFNCIDNVLDKLNCTTVPSGDKTSLCSLKSDFSLVDVWRKRNPRKVSFTWFNSDHTQASRIDRFLLAKSLVSNVSFCEILPCVLSDHDFVKLDFSLDNLTKRGPGVWRFNNSLLSDPDFKNLVSSAIADFKLKISCFDSLRDWWDSLKIEIRKVCVNFCVCKHKSLNANRILLTKQLIRAKNGSRDTSIINDLENQLSSLISKQADGAKIRSRAQWFEEGEKPTRYFFRLEQKRAESNSISSLFDDDGIEKNSQKDLENILSRFYQNLFTNDSLDM